jgi:hypothetical protein
MLQKIGVADIILPLFLAVASLKNSDGFKGL